MSAEFELWLNQGVERGWVSRPWCWSHDGPPLTGEEHDDDEPCFPCVRLVGDDPELAANLA